MTLFVGESPPNGGTFFYKGDSGLYRCMKEAFGGSEKFLAEFKANCYFLDDLVLYPVDKMPDKERDQHRRRAVPGLATWMAEYRPAAVVILMCAIENLVVSAMREAELSHIQHYVTPFPGRYHRQRFLGAMAEIIPQLPTC